jgi:hypothetical protein
MNCENVLFIQTRCIKQKEYFLDNLQTFIPYYKIIETFENIINCIFNTENPCIEFCKKICGLYNLNIQLYYFNKYNNYSGFFQIHNNQNTINQVCSYWQGLYNYNYDIFWKSLDKLFEEQFNFKELELSQKDLRDLENKFEYFLLFQKFIKL